MTNIDHPSNLIAEAERLTEKILKQLDSPTLRASIYNRCLESLGWIQEKSWEATDAKWSEILNSNEHDTEDTISKLRARNHRLSDALENLTDQVERSGAIDDHGHELKNLRAIVEARQLLGGSTTGLSVMRDKS